MSKNKSLLTPVMIILLCLGGWQAAQGATVSIRLKKQAQVDGETITLGEIAQLPDTLSKLNQVPLGKSPRCGHTVTITRQIILYHLKKNHLYSNKISFSGPDQCLVSRQYQEVTAKKIARLFKKRFFDRFSKKEFEIEKLRVHLAKKLKIPNGKIEYEISLMKPPQRQEETFALQIKQKGKLIKQVWISAGFRYHTTILIANQDLARGQSIAAGDVAIKPVILNNLNQHWITDPDRVVGLVCQQPIRAGRELTMNMLKQPLLVKKGAIIKMTAENNNLRITGLAKARANGRRGEIIPAENLTSQGKVYGVVIGENQIMVTF